jgi:hypothetical protein
VEEDDEEKEKKRKEKNTNTFFDYFLCVFVGKKISLLDVVYIPNKHQAHYHSRGISKAIDNNRWSHSTAFLKKDGRDVCWAAALYPLVPR